jgi:hypothetical protein
MAHGNPWTQVDVFLRHVTDTSYGVWDGKSRTVTGREKWIWLGKTQVRGIDDGNFTDLQSIEVPEWLALKEGLIT